MNNEEAENVMEPVARITIPQGTGLNLITMPQEVVFDLDLPVIEVVTPRKRDRSPEQDSRPEKFPKLELEPITNRAGDIMEEGLAAAERFARNHKLTDGTKRDYMNEYKRFEKWAIQSNHSDVYRRLVQKRDVDAVELAHMISDYFRTRPNLTKFKKTGELDRLDLSTMDGYWSALVHEFLDQYEIDLRDKKYALAPKTVKVADVGHLRSTVDRQTGNLKTSTVERHKIKNI